MRRRNDVITVHETKADSAALFLATQYLKKGLVFITIMRAKTIGTGDFSQ